MDMPYDTHTDPGLTIPADHPVRTGRSQIGRLVIVAFIAILALTAAACGSSKKSDTTDAAAGNTTSTTAGSTTTKPAAGASGASIALADTSLGKVVVDSDGRTLYLFEKDTGPTSTCTDACAKAWPAATVTGTPTAGDGVTGTISTTTRADGTTQIVLNGHPCTGSPRCQGG
jgi:predicted lipoprotein with Yx(FWY)xxD motif